MNTSAEKISSAPPFSQWATYYLHAPGASVAIYEDGSIETEKLKDKPLLGMYRLAHFKDKAAFNKLQAKEEWQKWGVTEKRADEIFETLRPLAQKKCPQDVMTGIHHAEERYCAALLPAQRRMIKPYGLKLIPQLWITSKGPAHWANHHSVIAITPDTTDATFNNLLENQWKYINDEEKKLTGANARIAPKNTWGNVFHTRARSIEERKNWVQFTLEEAQKTPVEFGELMRMLRVLGSSKNRREIGAEMGFSKEYINPAENFYEEFGKLAVANYTDFVLGSENPFLLPADHRGEIEPWVRELIEQARDTRLARYNTDPTHAKRRDEILASIEKDIKAYHERTLTEQELPNICDVLNKILPVERTSFKDRLGLCKYMYDGARDKYHLVRIKGILNTQNKTIPLDAEITSLAEYAECSPSQIALLLRLPRGKLHFFTPDYRLEMTQTRMIHTLTHPQEYKKAGHWIQALRNVRHVTLRSIDHAVHMDSGLQEDKESLSSDIIKKYLDPKHNVFDLPLGEDGRIRKEVADLFTAVASANPPDEQALAKVRHHLEWMRKSSDDAASTAQDKFKKPAIAPRPGYDDPEKPPQRTRTR